MVAKMRYLDDLPIPEIADRWTDGPVVRMSLVVPDSVAPGEDVPVRVFLTNNKTGHDFPTGPLDMIESWVEVVVTDSSGAEVFRAGGLDDDAGISAAPVVFRSDGYDREGLPIDRHNLWDLVGVDYKRVLYPGMSDTMEVSFQCPSLARGRVAPVLMRFNYRRLSMSRGHSPLTQLCGIARQIRNSWTVSMDTTRRSARL